MKKKKKSLSTWLAPDGRQGRDAGAQDRRHSARLAKNQPKTPIDTIPHFTENRNAPNAGPVGRRVLARLASICLAVALALTTAPAARAAAPEITVDAATGVTTSSATISGYINANRGINIRFCELQYRPSSSSYWTTCYYKYPANANDRSIGAHTLTGLASGTTYYYRAYAVNVNGEGSYSSTRYFTTIAKAAPPDVTASPATGITASGATISGYLNANKGVNIREFGLEYKLSSSSYWTNCFSYSYPSASYRDIGPRTLTGLSASTTYNYRAYAINVNGDKSYSSSYSFTTSDNVYLSLSPNGWHTLADEGGYLDVNIMSNAAWTSLYSNVSWLAVSNVSPASRKGNGSFRVTVSGNLGAARSGKVTFSAGGMTQTFTVDQNKGYSLALSPASWLPGAAGGYATISVAADGYWNFSSSDAAWLTVSNASPSSRYGSGSFRVNAAANNTGAARTGTVTLSMKNGLSRTIYVSQESNPLAADPKKIYKIRNANSGKYLNVADGYGGNGHDGRNVFQKGSDNSEFAQEFRIIYDSAKGAYRIAPICAHNGRNRVLDVEKSGNAVANGCNVRINLPKDENDVAQLFRIEAVGSGKYKILANSNTSVALTAYGTGNGIAGGTGSTSEGNVFMQTYGILTAQHWYLEEFPDRHEEYYSGLGFSLPIPSHTKITDGYGYRLLGSRDKHCGIDISAPEKTEIRAPFSGKVVAIGWDPGSMGNYIVMEADSKTVYNSTTKIQVVYMHMYEPPTTTNPDLKEKKKGEIVKVTTSTKVGKVGGTGGVPVHLHMTMVTDGSSSFKSFDSTNNPQMYYPKDAFTF